MTEIIAQTERLVLRTEAPGDLATWLAHMNTRQVMEKLGGLQSEEQVVEAFAKMAEASAADRPTFLFVALRDDGTLIGKCGLASIDTPCAPEPLRGALQIGWTLRADHWGKGYAMEAAQAALVMGFERFGADIVYSQTSERNMASWRLMARLGMARQSHQDYADPDYPPEDNPTMVWSIDKTRWLAAQAATDKAETR